MKRRDFIRSVSLACVGGSVFATRRARAALPALTHPVLAHVMMLGGPNFRHLLPPAFDADTSSYGYQFYLNNADAFKIEKTDSALAARWQNDYIHVNDGIREFGILGGCDWLADMWRAGHVAIVSNVVAAVSRDHAHAQSVWESADRTLTQTGHPLTGWAGRLADRLGDRVLSLTATPRPICLSQNVANSNAPGTGRIVTLANPNSVGVFEAASEADPTAQGISRALKQYYAATSATMPATALPRGFVDQERTLRLLGADLKTVFAGLTLPPEIGGLLSGAGALSTVPMAVQTRNLYYALAGTQAVDFHVASMAFGNWDSHDKQKEEFEPKVRDIFGANGALANLYRVLPDAVAGELVFMFSGEFGRQIRANGGNGTDHGRGNYVLLVGPSVKGGVYGEMFPAAELDRLEQETPDIEGRTHVDALLAQIIDHLSPGQAAAVLPGLSNAIVEPNVDLAKLFA